jgi:hypothetical protein
MEKFKLSASSKGFVEDMMLTGEFELLPLPSKRMGYQPSTPSPF